MRAPGLAAFPRPFVAAEVIAPAADVARNLVEAEPDAEGEGRGDGAEKDVGFGVIGFLASNCSRTLDLSGRRLGRPRSGGGRRRGERKANGGKKGVDESAHQHLR